jgi:release factor glutamine methyltransferase
LYLYHRVQICRDVELQLEALLARRAAREPLQYILGEVDFCNVTLNVDPSVLIPRSETEYLVEWVVDYVCKSDLYCTFKRPRGNPSGNESPLYSDGPIISSSMPNILDLGTGSGAIAIALAKYFSESHVVGVDQSPMALQVARENQKRNHIENLDFLESDWYSALKIRAEMFDIIVANPPYLTQQEFETAQEEIRQYEPFRALVAENDGLRDIEIILGDARNFLKKNGVIAIETGVNHPSLLREKYKNDFGEIEILQDLCQRDRFLIAHL